MSFIFRCSFFIGCSMRLNTNFYRLINRSFKLNGFIASIQPNITFPIWNLSTGSLSSLIISLSTIISNDKLFGIAHTKYQAIQFLYYFLHTTIMGTGITFTVFSIFACIPKVLLISFRGITLIVSPVLVITKLFLVCFQCINCLRTESLGEIPRLAKTLCICAPHRKQGEHC